MSVCVEQCNFKNELKPVSQVLPAKSKVLGFSRSNSIAHKGQQNSNTAKLSIFGQVKLYMARYRQRKVLAQLDDRMLADIGYTAEQVSKECSLFFWK